MMNQQRKKRSLSKWFKRRSKYNFVHSVDDASEYEHFRSASAMSSWSDGRESPTTTDFHLKLSEFEEQIKQLKTENDRLRHQMIGLEDESADLTVERNELQAQLDKQKDLLERKLSVTKRDVEENNGQLSVIDSSKDTLEQEIKILRKEKRERDLQLKETNEKMSAYETRLKASEQIQTSLSDKVKKMWLLKEKEINERKVLLSLLKSAESFAKSQEEVILELLYKIKELKHEIIDKDVELAGLRQKCYSVDRIDFLDREIEIDVSFDYNKNELSFDEFDLDVGASAFSPVDTSSFLVTAARLSTQQQLQQRQQQNSTPYSPIATTLLNEDPRSPKNVPCENQLHQSSKFWNELYAQKINEWKQNECEVTGRKSAIYDSCVDSGYVEETTSVSNFDVTLSVRNRSSPQPLGKRNLQQPVDTVSVRSECQRKSNKSLFELFCNICSDSTTFVTLLFLKFIALGFFFFKLPFKVTNRILYALGAPVFTDPTTTFISDGLETKEE